MREIKTQTTINPITKAIALLIGAMIFITLAVMVGLVIVGGLG